MKVVGHDDVGEDHEAGGGASLVEGAAAEGLEGVGVEDREAVLGDGGDGEARRVSGNRHHGFVAARRSLAAKDFISSRLGKA